MKLYEVKARVDEEGYREAVQVYEDMVEKPKTFCKDGLRLSKSDLYKIREDYFGWGTYQILVLSEEDVPQARQNLKHQIREDVDKEFKSIARKREAILMHGLNSEIKFTTGGGIL